VLWKNDDCVSHDELNAVEELIAQHGQITDTRLDNMQDEYTNSIAAVEAQLAQVGAGWEEIDLQLYVDDEIANDPCWSGMAARFGNMVAFELTITDRYKLNEAKDDERLWIEFAPGPSGWARTASAHGHLQDGNDTIHGSLRWLQHPDLGRWMVAFEFLRDDGTRGFLSKHNNYHDAANGRVIESGSKYGGVILLPPAF